MLESAFWNSLRYKLSPHGKFVRVENKVLLGTPDVAYCVGGASGWIELKVVAGIPKRNLDQPWRLTHYGAPQQRFAKEWGMAGGSSWLLVRFDNPRYFFLWDWRAAQLIGTREKMGKATWPEVEARATWASKNVDIPKIVTVLTFRT